MKKRLLFFAAVFCTMTQLLSQNTSGSQEVTKEDRNFRMPLIGENAPSFTAESTNGTINFPADFGRKWKILFSHPADFTPVCTTEILEMASLQSELDKLGIKLLVVSTGTLETHSLWKKSMESLNLNDREAVKIKFPLVDDNNLVISKKYGMIHPKTNSTKSVRGVFIIDPDNLIQAIFFYPFSVGRSTDELLRTVTALQTTSSEAVYTPVNWKSGDDLLVPIPPNTDKDGAPIVTDGYYSPVWYLWYKKGNQPSSHLR